jgi:plastocyanin
MVAPRPILALALLSALALAGCSGGDAPEGRSDEPTPSPSASDGLSVSASATVGPSPSASSSNSSSSSAPASPQTIAKDVADNSFPDGTFTIRAGDTVVWTHRGSPTTPHSVTSAGNFDSHPNCPPVCMLAGQTYSRTFDDAGTFDYVCKIHGSMTGTITVTAT